MNKLLALILTLLLCLSAFTACDNKKDEAKNPLINFNSGDLKIADTIKTDDWEFTLTDVEYGTNLSNYSSRDDYLYELPEGDERRNSPNKAYLAKEGRGFVVLIYNLKYTGPESAVYTGNTTLKYNGELYEDHPYSNSDFNLKADDGFDGYLEYTFENSDEYEVRVCFDVPYEIIENEEAPLEVIVNFDKVYTYKVR